MKKRTIINIVFIVAALCVVFTVQAWRNDINHIEPKLKEAEVFLKGDEISALYAREDCLLVGGKDGVKRVDYDSGKVLGYEATDIKLIYAAGIIKTDDGSMWIGHNDGVTVIYSDGIRQNFKAPDITGGRTNTLRQIGNYVYCGTMQGAAVFEKKGSKWAVKQKLTKKNGLAADPVNVIASINNDIFFGSYLDNKPGGISILSDKGWSYISVKEGLAHPYINAIEQVDDKIYVGCGQLTAGGLSVIENKNDKYEVTDLYDKRDNIPGAKVRYVYKDSVGHIWITTESDGLILVKDKSSIVHKIDGVILNENDGLSDNEIKSIAETEEAYYLAGRYGLTKIPKTQIEKLLS